MSKQPGLLAEVVHYLRKYKRWWLLPILVVLLLFLLLGLIAKTVPVISPFIYTVF